MRWRPAPIVAAMSKLQSQSTSNPTSIVQKAAVAALKGPQECVDQMMAEYISLRDHVLEGLRTIPGIALRQAAGRVLRVSERVELLRARRRELRRRRLPRTLLREAHVAVVPGEGFGTREHIRISYATSRKELDRGMERMRRFFAAL